MAFDYADAAATATELLADFGAPATLRSVSTAYDPATSRTTPTTTNTTVTGVLLDFAQGQTFGPGGLIQAGDKQFLMAVGSVVPALGNKLIASGGVMYTVLGVGELKPAASVVMYTLHVRN